jgi:hypothetical protein
MIVISLSLFCLGLGYLSASKCGRGAASLPINLRLRSSLASRERVKV